MSSIIRMFFQTMRIYQLGTIEVRIGLIESWSRDILRLLFCWPQINHNIRTVSAFFYGNGVVFP